MTVVEYMLAIIAIVLGLAIGKVLDKFSRTHFGPLLFLGPPALEQFLQPYLRKEAYRNLQRAIIFEEAFTDENLYAIAHRGELSLIHI